MPIDRNPVPTTPPAATTFRKLVDGDAVNADDLFDEVSPGAKPKLTLGLLLDYVYGIAHPGSITRSIPGIFLNDPSGSPAVFFDAGTVASTKQCVQQFNPPHGSTLTKCTLYVNPTNATPPAGTKIQAVVNRYELSTNTLTAIVTTTDPATSTAYGAAHAFDTGTMAEVIDLTRYAYNIRLVGETGSGASACDWNGSTYTVTI